MEYELMIPPFEHQGFKGLNGKQVKEYFQWYIRQIDYRIEVLNKYLLSQGEKIDFNYSPESLIPLWEWYERNIIIENKTEEELISEFNKYPEWMKDEISHTKISIQTLKFGMDIAIYFAQVIIKNSSGKIDWGYFTKPKNMMSVNQPVLLGFKANMDLNPRLIIINCTRHSSEEKDNMRFEFPHFFT